MQLSQERRDEVQKAIVDLIIKGIGEGTIVDDDLSPIGKFVLEKIDTLQTEDQMVAFLEEFSQKWPVFSGILTVEKGKITQQVESQAAQNVVDLANQGNIDQAVDLAKSVTEPVEQPAQQQ